MRFRFFAPLLAIAMLGAVSARAADDDSNIPPNAPPDIVRIIKKANSGQQPTPDEMQRLMEYMTQVQSRMGVPVGTPDANGQMPAAPEGIPARATVHFQYTWTYDKGTGHGSGVLDATGNGKVIATDGGNANWGAHVGDTSTGVAQFRLEPALDGSGSLHCENKHGDTLAKIDARLSSAGLAVTLQSTGGANLWPADSGLGAMADITVQETDTATGTTNTTHEQDSRWALGCEFASSPFVQEWRMENGDAGEPPMPKDHTPPPRIAIPYAALSKAVKTGETTTVTASESYDYGDGKGFEKIHVDTKVTLTLHPKDLQLIVEPWDRDAYEKWLPLPDEKESGAPELFGKPPRFQVHAALHDSSKPIVEAGGHTRPDADRGGRIDLYLTEVSQNKGIAMNFPPPGKGDDKPDLFFPKDGQPTGIHWVDESHVYTESEDAVEATAVVAARDTGAYGKISGECKALGTKSKSWESDDEFFTMPRDKNGNHVADQWEKDHKVFDDGFAPDWDGENLPTLSTAGDDLVLFEEYRGFVVEEDPSQRNETFRRMEPLDREVFVFVANKDRELKIAGLRMFEKTSGFHVRFLHSRDRAAVAAPHTYPTWVNFNQTGFSKDKAFGLYIDDLDTYNSEERSIGGVLPEVAQRPSLCDVVNVSRKNAENLVWQFRQWAKSSDPSKPMTDGAAAIGMSLHDVSTWAEAHDDVLANRLITWTTLHECSHAIGGRHHGINGIVAYNESHAPDPNGKLSTQEQVLMSSGSPSCPMRYWDVGADKRETVLFLSGKWDLTTPADGGAWSYCDADKPNVGLLPK